VQNQDLDLLSAGQMGDDAGNGAWSGRGRADFQSFDALFLVQPPTASVPDVQVFVEAIAGFG